MNHKPSGDATRLLDDISKGDHDAIEKLLPIVYDELRVIAASFMRHERPNHTLQPTALVHEAFMKLVGPRGPKCNDRGHFLAVAALAMRRILVNHAIALKTDKRGGKMLTLQLQDSDAVNSSREVDTLALNDAMIKLATLDERKAKVVEQRFFGGMSVQEVADTMDVSVSTVESDWRMAKAWLSDQLDTSR